MMKPLEKTPPPPQKLWVREKHRIELVRPEPAVDRLLESRRSPAIRPDLSHSLEPFAKIVRELPSLFERHWQELALNKDTIPLEPNWDRYFELAATGALHVMTARSDGVLVGYIFNIVGPHLHYRSTPHAQIEMFWLDPAYRGGTFALRWLKANEAEMKKLGAKRIIVAVKNHYLAGRVGNIFRRLGYLPIETVYSKVNLWA